MFLYFYSCYNSELAIYHKSIEISGMCVKLKESKKSDKKSIDNLNSIDKTLNVIDCIFNEQEASFIDLKSKLGIPKATLHRILLSLERNEYIKKNELTDKYSLGIKFVYYGESIRSNITIVKIAESILKDLAKTVDETVNIGIQYDNSVLNIFSVKGEESALTSKLVPISPLNCSSIGKIILANKNDLELMSYFNNKLYEKRTPNSISTFEDFKKEQKKILESEISIDNEEYELGLFCIAVPLKNHKGILPAAVSMTGPKVRMEMKNIDTLIKKMKEKTEIINDILIKMKYELDY